MRSVWINMSIKRKKENHLIIRIHDFILQPIYFILTIHSIINPLHPLIYQLYQKKSQKNPKNEIPRSFLQLLLFLENNRNHPSIPPSKENFFHSLFILFPPLRRQLLTMPVYSYPSSPDDGASTQRVWS